MRLPKNSRLLSIVAVLVMLIEAKIILSADFSS